MQKILVVDDDAELRELLRLALELAGYPVSTVADGIEALQQLEQNHFDLMLTDVWMPRMNGLELLSKARLRPGQPKLVVMTRDDTPETMLQAIREQAHAYIAKPFEPKALLEVIRKVLAASERPAAIEVLSARPEWVELLVPCELEAAERIQAFLNRLEADLADEVREQLGQAFRELLLNAIEWGGQLDPNRKVRIACVRGRRMLLYRIADPGPGFRLEGLSHAALHNPSDNPAQHMQARMGKGLRPGGFGLLLVQAIADELIFNEARNEVLFVKYLDKPDLERARP